mgnify:CR=1 FL=1
MASREMLIVPANGRRSARSWPLVMALCMALSAIVVGMLINLVPPAFVAPLLVPLFLLAAWTAPKREKAPIELLLFLTIAWLVSIIVWPRYVAANVPGLPDVVPGRIVFLVLVGLWTYALLTTAELSRNFRVRVGDAMLPLLFLATYAAFRFASIFASDYPFHSAYGFINEAITGILPFFILATVLRDARDLRVVLLAVVFSGGAVAALGLVESILGRNPIAANLPPGFVLSSEFIAQAAQEKIRGTYRAQSTFSHPLLFGEFLVLAVPLTIFAAVHDPNRLVRLTSWLLLPAMGLALFRSGSRAAMLTMAGTVAILFIATLFRAPLTRRSNPATWLGIVALPAIFLGIAVGVIAALDIVTGRSLQEMQSSSARLFMWQRGLFLIENSPFIGYGVYRAAEVLGFTGRGGVLTVDSYYLTLLLESGWPSLILFLMFAVSILSVCGKLAIFDRSETGGLAVAIAASLTGVLTMRAILSTPYNLPLFFALCGVVLALYSWRGFGRSFNTKGDGRCQNRMRGGLS